MPDQDHSRKSTVTTWVILASVFVAAVMVTVFIGTRDDGESNEFPDLGDIAESDPNLPANAEPAPTFAVETLDGKGFDLARHLAEDGRPVVLNLWASWCPPCRAEMPAINTSSQRHPEIKFVGVAVKDTAEEARAFADEIGIEYTIGFDDGSVDDAYPVLGLPATFYIDGNGILVKTHVGPVTIDSLDDDIAQLFGS
ncbi:MAG: TlpA disulfide reductase family protein [Acidimicrobiia bacterium]|nr:TlpA disulfide reductase family protein [Acidimicrobiia bacterium]